MERMIRRYATSMGRAIRHTGRCKSRHDRLPGWSTGDGTLATPLLFPSPSIAMTFLINGMQQRIDIFVLRFLIECAVEQPPGIAFAMSQYAEDLKRLG